MSLDISQFLPVFFEEAAEHLETMEAGLLAVQPGRADHELVNAIFRAAHSIKGGAGTFGLADVAEFTHKLETLLDLVRHERLVLDEQRVDASLAAVDLLGALIAAYKGGDPPAAAMIAELESELERLARPEEGRGDFDPDSASQPVQPVTQADPGYGLFDDVAQQDDPGYGFFDDAGDGSDAAYGLFDQEQVQPSAYEPSGGQTSGYGFFDDAPGAPERTPDPSTAAADPGYGFFEPLEGESVATSVNAVPDSAGLASNSAHHGEEDEAALFDQTGKARPYGLFRGAPGYPAVAQDGGQPGHASTTGASPGERKSSHAAKGEPGEGGGDGQSRRPSSSAASPTDTSIRVGTAKVDQLINLVGELVITQSMLLQSAQVLDPVMHERMLAGLAQLERNSRDLQEAVLSIRMVPMSLVFSRFPRMVRDLAKKLDKQAELHLVGESTELDKGLTEKLVDPLTHLVRNSVDHGLEDPAARLAAGKTAVGHVTLAASHQSGHVLIEISDDGAGLSRERILAKAVSNGLSVNPDAPDGEVWDLIFAPGFSTAEAVTDVSGRGVGMDVVRRNIHALGGSVSLSSVTGSGTRVSIRLPLTLAILDGMSIRAGSETFIVPLGYIVESIQGQDLSFKTVGRDGRLVQVRDEYIPVVSLTALFALDDQPLALSESVLVVLESQSQKIAVAVDELLGQHQVVVKNLETNFRRVQGISGATILGDGKVSLILDVDGMLNLINPTIRQV